MRTVKINSEEYVAQLVVFDSIVIGLKQNARVFALQVAAAVLNDEPAYDAPVSEHRDHTCYPFTAQCGVVCAFKRDLFIKRKIAGVRSGAYVNGISSVGRVDRRLNGLKLIAGPANHNRCSRSR